MKKPVVNQSYELGIAWDKTEFRNHGVLHYATRGTGTFRNCLSFAPGRTAPGSCVAIPPSKSLRDLGSVRVRTKIYTNSEGRRQNIVEGHLSFALFLNPDLSIQGTFHDPNGRWPGIRSRKKLFPNRWYDVEFRYDGISVGEIFVNGDRLATSFVAGYVRGGPMAGPVRGVGPHGVFIGHWPEPDDRYTFDGYIRHMQIFKRDDKDMFDHIDPCCGIDVKEWLKLAYRMTDAGFTPEKLQDLLNRMSAAGVELAADMRGESESDARRFDEIANQFLYAMRNRGSVPVEASLEPLMEWIADRIQPDKAAEMQATAEEIIGEVPFSKEELLELADSMCFKELRESIENIRKRAEDDPRWKKKRESFEQG